MTGSDLEVAGGLGRVAFPRDREKAKGGVCATCYGRLADGAFASVGYPVGLAAAHDLDPHTVGKTIQNARLAWSDATLPLKSCFSSV